MLKKCCYDGANRNYDETCEQRAARIKVGPWCAKAFRACCDIASQHRTDSNKPLQLGRLRKCGLSVGFLSFFLSFFLKSLFIYS